MFLYNLSLFGNWLVTIVVTCVLFFTILPIDGDATPFDAGRFLAAYAVYFASMETFPRYMFDSWEPYGDWVTFTLFWGAIFFGIGYIIGYWLFKDL